MQHNHCQYVTFGKFSSNLSSPKSIHHHHHQQQQQQQNTLISIIIKTRNVITITYLQGGFFQVVSLPHPFRLVGTKQSGLLKSVLVFVHIFKIISSIIIVNTYLNMENYVYYCYILL